MRSKLAISALVLASFALSGTFAYAQTSRDGTVGGPAARQDTGDPLIRKPTSGEAVNGSTDMTTGNSRRNINGNPGPQPKEPAVGGPASSQQSSGSSGG